MKRILHSATKISKLRSFTLTEVLIATILSAILLAFVVTIFSFLITRIHSESKNMDQMEELLLLQSGLQQAARLCDSILIVNDQIMFYGSEGREAYAQFADSLIIIGLSETCDTFELSPENICYTYMGRTPLISGIEFEIRFRTFTVPVSLIKEYDGAIQVNSRISIR